MKFEKAGIDDICALTNLRIAYLLEDYGFISEEKLQLIRANLPVYFGEHLNRDLFVWVCRKNGIIVSCCFLCITEKPASPAFINGKTGTILNVYTMPEYRKRGIAKKLLSMLLVEAENKELDFVELKSTDSGYGLYKVLGFEDAASKYHNMKYVFQ